jgi:hypothetical protein
MAWQWQMLAYGLLLIALVFFLPRGIVPSFERWHRSRAASGAGHPRSKPASRAPLQ